MNEDLGNKYFIILNKDEIIFNCLNDKNKISFAKKYNLKDKNLNNLYSELENFLSDNLIQIEKKLDKKMSKDIPIFRICLNSSAKNKFHQMIIFQKNIYSPIIKKETKKDKSFILLKGRKKIRIYNKKKKIIKY